MPITFNCSCGKVLRAPDEHAGKRVRCPACAGVSTVPEPEPMFEVVEDTAAPMFEVVEGTAAPKARPVARPVAAVVDDDDEDDRRGYDTSDADRDAGEDRSRRQKKPKWQRTSEKKRKKSKEPGRSLEGKVFNGGVAVGILSMLGAVVWLVAGILLLDRIFYYPPILFIIGLVGFIKGLIGDGDE